MSRKQYPVLTAQTCEPLENLRQAIEILTGKNVRYIQIDLNTCRGEVLVGGERKSLAYEWSLDLEVKKGFAKEVNFVLGPDAERSSWYRKPHIAYFDQAGQVFALDHDEDKHIYRGGGLLMVQAGHTLSDRHLVPYSMESAISVAKRRGTTVEVLLRS
jgi:hypothetical protein